MTNVRSLEAQREAVERFAERKGYELVGDAFVEVETGKGVDALERRPVLAAALAAARRAHYPVVVAKLDRRRLVTAHPHSSHSSPRSRLSLSGGLPTFANPATNG
jgi:DNA invertase Pin-like site-specific DNA recombinase